MICERRVKEFCKDDITKIENYEEAKADTETWDCHHKLELHPDHSVRFTRASLKKLDLYYNRPASELIFLTKTEHRRLHHNGENNPLYGKHHSDETRKKLSELTKGENHPMYGKHRSEETRKKMSESHKAHWARRHAEST